MKIRFLTASILIVAFLGGTPRFVYAVSTSVSNLLPTADTYVDSSKPGTNFGSGSTIWIDGSSPTRRGLLRFSLASIPAGSKITSAILRLHVASDGSATAGSLKGVSGSWVENSVTYSTAPAVGAGITTISGPAAPNSTVSVDLTSYVAGKTSLSLYLVTSNTDGVKYYSHEQGSTLAPRLVITWMPATVTPTTSRTGTPTTTKTATAPAPSRTPSPTPSSTPAATRTASPTPSATPTSAEPESLTLPLRLAFYYTNYPKAWTAGSIYPYTNYTPSLGFYDSMDPATILQHISSMQYAHIQGGIVFWPGPLTPDDSRFPALLEGAASGRFKWALDYTAESGSNPSPTTISSDLAYVHGKYAREPAYLRIGGKPIIFVRAGGEDGCEMADRWKQADTLGFYVVLKVFSGYPNCVSQPDNWHQYGPAADYDVQGSHSVSVSPGYWIKGRTAALPRDLAHWYQNIRNMIAAKTDFQLITTWNGWAEGTQLESSVELEATHLEALHNNGTDPTVMAAGDIVCPDLVTTDTTCQQMAVSQLVLDQKPNAAFVLGDLCHNTSADCFYNYYDPSWGRVFSISRPITGNHEYGTTGAPYYFDYWNGAGVTTGRAGERGKSYYSFEVGTWHVVALNSQCEYIGGCALGSPEYTWLQQDLASHPNQCTMAISHKPLFGSTSLTSSITRPLWQLLYDSNADLILDGHSHTYERFAPQDPNGVADPLRGIREIIVGTGGAFHTGIGAVAANSEARDAVTFGALKLTLHPGGYDWRFMPIPGQTFTDAGTTLCH